MEIHRRPKAFKAAQRWARMIGQTEMTGGSQSNTAAARKKIPVQKRPVISCPVPGIRREAKKGEKASSVLYSRKTGLSRRLITGLNGRNSESFINAIMIFAC